MKKVSQKTAEVIWKIKKVLWKVLEVFWMVKKTAQATIYAKTTSEVIAQQSNHKEVAIKFMNTYVETLIFLKI